MITVDLKSDVETRLAAQAEAHGLRVEAYAEKLLQRAVESEAGAWDRFGPGARTPEEAGRDILVLRRNVTLGGVKIKDLIHEGHRH